jgi:hypothetical protein
MRAAPLVFLIVWALACGRGVTTLVESTSEPLAGDPSLVYSSLQSGITEELRLVIRSQPEWAAFWAGLHAQGTGAAAVPPVVDFSRHVVAVAALGSRERSGYRVDLPRHQRVAARREVTVLKTSPDPACPTAPVFTTPAAAAVIPADAAIVFIELEIIAPCD